MIILREVLKMSFDALNGLHGDDSQSEVFASGVVI